MPAMARNGVMARATPKHAGHGSKGGGGGTNLAGSETGLSRKRQRLLLLGLISEPHSEVLAFDLCNLLEQSI